MFNLYMNFILDWLNIYVPIFFYVDMITFFIPKSELFKPSWIDCLPEKQKKNAMQSQQITDKVSHAK